MNQLVLSLAQDFSVELNAQFGWREPADEYFNPIVGVFRETPSKENAVHILNERVSDLTAELSRWLEVPLEDTDVRDILYRALINYYGDF